MLPKTIQTSKLLKEREMLVARKEKRKGVETRNKS